MHVAVAMEINRRLLPGLKELLSSLEEKRDQFKDIIKIGRTHTQVCACMCSFVRIVHAAYCYMVMVVNSFAHSVLV